MRSPWCDANHTSIEASFAKTSCTNPEKLERLRRNSETAPALELETEEDFDRLGGCCEQSTLTPASRARRRWRLTSRSAALFDGLERAATNQASSAGSDRARATDQYAATPRISSLERDRMPANPDQQGIAGRIVHGQRRTKIREWQRDQTAPNRIAARREQACGQRRIGVTYASRPTAARRRRGAEPRATAPDDRGSRRDAIRPERPMRRGPLERQICNSGSGEIMRACCSAGSLKSPGRRRFGALCRDRRCRRTSASQLKIRASNKRARAAPQRAAKSRLHECRTRSPLFFQP